MQNEAGQQHLPPSQSEGRQPVSLALPLEHGDLFQNDNLGGRKVQIQVGYLMCDSLSIQFIVMFWKLPKNPDLKVFQWILDSSTDSIVAFLQLFTTVNKHFMMVSKRQHANHSWQFWSDLSSKTMDGSWGLRGISCCWTGVPVPNSCGKSSKSKEDSLVTSESPRLVNRWHVPVSTTSSRDPKNGHSQLLH